MPTGPHEPDRGTTAPAGPLGPATPRPQTQPARDEGWRTVPGKPYLQENVLTGRLRTHDYQPTTRL